MWDPTDETYYPDGVMAERAMGIHYDLLQVEQTLDGWHGIVMVWNAPEEFSDTEPGLCLADEAVFTAKYDATTWCETKNTNAAEAQRALAIYQEDEDSVEFWDAMLDDVGDLEEYEP